MHLSQTRGYDKTLLMFSNRLCRWEGSVDTLDIPNALKPLPVNRLVQMCPFWPLYTVFATITKRNKKCWLWPRPTRLPFFCKLPSKTVVADAVFYKKHVRILKSGNNIVFTFTAVLGKQFYNSERNDDDGDDEVWRWRVQCNIHSSFHGDRKCLKRYVLHYLHPFEDCLKGFCFYLFKNLFTYWNELDDIICLKYLND